MNARHFWTKSGIPVNQIGVQRVEENDGKFFMSIFNGKRILHLQPTFKKIPKSYNFEIYGTDGLILEGSQTINRGSVNQKQTISFDCNIGQTYFCKIVGFYLLASNGDQTKYEKQEFRLFYTVNDDFDNEESDNEEENDLQITKINPGTQSHNSEGSDEATDVEDVDDDEIEQVSDRQEEEEDNEISDDDINQIRQYIAGGSGIDISQDSDS